MRKLFSTFAVGVVIFMAAAAANAHTYHSTLARIDFNSKDKTYEVSLQLFIHDVLPMLEKRLKKRVDIEKSPEVDATLAAYIADGFVMFDKAGAKIPIKWVGKEFENDVVYAFFEIPVESAASAVKLQNTLFFESFPEQTNLVIADLEGRKVNLSYKSGERIKDFFTSL